MSGSNSKSNTSFGKEATVAVELVSGPSGTQAIRTLLCHDSDSEFSHLSSILVMVAASFSIVAFVSVMLSVQPDRHCSISPTVPFIEHMEASVAVKQIPKIGKFI